MSTKVAVFDDVIELEPVSSDTPVTPLSPFVKRSNEQFSHDLIGSLKPIWRINATPPNQSGDQPDGLPHR